MPDYQLSEIKIDGDGDVWMRQRINYDGIHPPKPSKRELEKLGAEYEAAELAKIEMWAGDGGSYSLSPDNVPFDEFERIMHRHYVARLDYISAVSDHALYIRAKAWHTRRVISPTKGFWLKWKAEEAMARAAKLEELDELGCIKGRELIDAQSASMTARCLYLIEQEKFQNAERQALADKRAGINRS